MTLLDDFLNQIKEIIPGLKDSLRKVALDTIVKSIEDRQKLINSQEKTFERIDKQTALC